MADQGGNSTFVAGSGQLLEVQLLCKSITFRKIESFSGFDAIIIFVSLILSTMIFMFLMYPKSNPFMSRIREFICFGV